MIDLQLLGGLAVAGHDVSPDSTAPRRRGLALLALVAAAAPQPIARDKVLALLWPESDATRARNSLRQTIFALRRDLNEDLFLPESRSGLQLDAAHIRVDAWRFREAMLRDAPDEAIAAYRGPFLDGFHVPGLSAFSQWAEAERDRLEREHLTALERLARCAQCEGRIDEAVSWRRQIAAADPLSSRATLGLLTTLAAAGDRAGALKHAAAHERRMREELETEPDPVITEFVASLRRDVTPLSVARVAPEESPVLVAPTPQPITPAAPVAVTDGAPRAAASRPRYRSPGWLAIAAVIVAVTGMAGKWVAAALPPTEVVLGSGLRDVESRDPANRLIACSGPACPAARLPIDAYVVVAHPSYAPPSGGTHYIAPVPDATTSPGKGYACCTTATFENTFHLPADAVSATIAISTYADNQAIVAINGVEFGRQSDKLGAENYAAFPTRFVTTFVPDPSGTNRLRVTLWDGGGALGLRYRATVTYETESSRRKETTATGK